MISIHAPLAGRDYEYCVQNVRAIISIHAPLAGRDAGSVSSMTIHLMISIHAPLAGRDRQRRLLPPDALAYFNPRAPCGARRENNQEV